MAGIQEKQKEPIRVFAVAFDGTPLTGKTSIKMKIQRKSDRLYFDWSDNTFKAGASVTSLLQVLSEVSATYSAGIYELNTGSHVYGFDTSLITNYTTGEIYFLTVIQDGEDDAVNLPQVGEIRAGSDVISDKSPVLF
jgi:hypothetical protein